MADTRLEMLSKMDRNPIEETEYKNLLAQSNLPYFQGGNTSSTAAFRAAVGYGGPSAPAFDPIAQAQKLRQFNIESAQPQISSLQAQIPETEQRFAAEQTRLGGEKEPFKQRYQSIIDELTRRESVDVTAAQRRTGQEFGYRGIPASSTLYLDELARAESPIRQAYGGQIKDVGFERETGLRSIDQLISNLAGQSTEAKRTIQNAIGQLSSGNPSDALAGAMQILQLQQQQAQFQQQQTLAQQQQALREREFGLQEEIARRPQQQEQYATLSEGQTLFNLLTGQQVFKNPKTYKAAVGAGNLPDLNTIFG